ncbi:MAG: hypothetical protein Q9187_000642 [Circinaria calcarea]
MGAMPPFEESTEAMLMMEPRRLGTGELGDGEGGKALESMCAPTSRQSVKATVRLTWRTSFPVGVGKLVGEMAALYAAAVEEDVDGMAVCEDGGDEGGDRGLVGEVGGVDDGFAAEGFDGSFGAGVGGGSRLGG